MSDTCGEDSNLHVHIEPDDCVLILKPNGHIEYLLPDADDDEYMPEHAVVATALAGVASDQDLCGKVVQMVFEKAGIDISTPPQSQEEADG